MHKSPEELIEKLHILLRKEGVFYTDYRIELIDHLICSVENEEGDILENIKL